MAIYTNGLIILQEIINRKPDSARIGISSAFLREGESRLSYRMYSIAYIVIFLTQVSSNSKRVELQVSKGGFLPEVPAALT